MKKKATFLSTFLGVVMFFALWQLLAFGIDRPILPSPIVVVPLFFQNLSGELGLHFLASSARVLAAVFLATLFAAPLGLALGQMPKLDRVIGPPDCHYLSDPQNYLSSCHLCADGDQ